jgi:hypothetical protein
MVTFFFTVDVGPAMRLVAISDCSIDVLEGVLSWWGVAGPMPNIEGGCFCWADKIRIQ